MTDVYVVLILTVDGLECQVGAGGGGGAIANWGY